MARPDVTPEMPMVTAPAIKYFKDWIFDPVPEWLVKDKNKLREFARLEVELRKKELQIEIERMEALEKLI